MFKPLVFAAASSLLIAACGEASDLDVGDPKAELGTALTDYAAHWDGYAQAYTFSGDDTDRVRLVLDEQGNGTIRFGSEALFPAASDPEAWYPPTYLQSPNDALGAVGLFDLNLKGVRSGFEFPVSGASVEGARLKFEFDPNTLMDGWCALQTNDPFEDWTCGDGFSATGSEEPICEYRVGETEVHHEIGCARAAQCFSCECDNSGCRARGEKVATFDAVLTDEGATLEGTLVLDDTRVTVIMSQ